MPFDLFNMRAFAVSGLFAVSLTTGASAQTALQTALTCLTDEKTGLRAISQDDIQENDALPIVRALVDVIEYGRTIPGNAPDWTLEETIIGAFAQQADALRTGAVLGQLYEADQGLIYTWEDRFLGSVCLYTVAASMTPQSPPAQPVIGTDTIAWIADPTEASEDTISQIILVSDRPQ